MRFIIALIAFFYFYQSFAHVSDRPDGHAPIGVMADHTHSKGETMISLRSMQMTMRGLQSGTHEQSSSDVFSNTSFMMAPQKMEMWMHMLGAMYAVTDRLTLMAMLPYKTNQMTMIKKMEGDTFKSDSRGIGDVSITSMYSLLQSNKQRMIVTMGLFFPTGSIEKDHNGTRLGYPMQLGSGSYALKPSFVFSHYWNWFSIGSQFNYKYFLNENSANYKLGNETLLTLWGAVNFCENFSSSLRLSHKAIDPIKARDLKINAMMSPSNRSDLQHGNTSMVFLGINLLGTQIAKGHRLALEWGLPISQDLSGPQMKAESVVTLGWQKAF